MHEMWTQRPSALCLTTLNVVLHYKPSVSLSLFALLREWLLKLSFTHLN